jgi:hypothetical protein
LYILLSNDLPTPFLVDLQIAERYDSAFLPEPTPEKPAALIMTVKPIWPRRYCNEIKSIIKGSFR